MAPWCAGTVRIEICARAHFLFDFLAQQSHLVLENTVIWGYYANLWTWSKKQSYCYQVNGNGLTKRKSRLE